MVKRGQVSASRCLWMWEDSGGTEFLEFMTREATSDSTHNGWRHEQNTSGFTNLYDDAGLIDVWERITVCKDAVNSLTTWTALGTYTNTDSKAIAGGANGLDTIYIGGKSVATNEFGFPAYLADIAIWPGTQLVEADHTLLESYWASTIPKVPTYNWRGASDLTNTLGGIDLKEAGVGISHTIASGDNPSLTNYAVNGPLLVGGNIILGPNGGILTA